MFSSTALYTDQYELTMVRAALQAGIDRRHAVFETFARRLPTGRRYGVFAGLGRLVEALERFRFGDDELAFLRQRGVLDDDTLAWLADYRFSGTITAYAEGDLYFAESPVLRAEGPFAETVLLETIVLSHLNYDSAVASAAARMVTAAGPDQVVLEFGARRAHEEAAVAAARAAYLTGFGGTSNLEAGRRYGIPTSGTSAHAFTLAFHDEGAAFRAQVAALGADTVLLVDTYDVEEGIRRAVEAAGPELGGVRIDSGELEPEAQQARRQLDELGARDTRIILSGDLDEYVIATLRDDPVSAYGVGTRVVTGSGAPTGEFIYKLVAIADTDDPQAPLRAVAKAGGVKATVGGGKRAWRVLGDDGRAVEEVVAVDTAVPPTGARELRVPVLLDGKVLPPPTLDEIRATHAAAKAELSEEGLLLTDGPPAIPTRRVLETG